MKKILMTLAILSVMTVTSGCTSYIAAKYDDFNETFEGTAFYDPSYGRASINLRSDINNTVCTGSTPFYQGLYVYNYNLVCSDGRMIIGSMNHGKYEGHAFTNRNETMTFVISKTKNGAKKNAIDYKDSVKHKPALDNKKEPIKVILEPNKF